MRLNHRHRDDTILHLLRKLLLDSEDLRKRVERDERVEITAANLHNLTDQIKGLARDRDLLKGLGDQGDSA